MPMYEYRCPKCDTRFERLLRLSERDDPQPCPNEKCDEKETQKMISAPPSPSRGVAGRVMGIRGETMVLPIVYQTVAALAVCLFLLALMSRGDPDA